MEPHDLPNIDSSPRVIEPTVSRQNRATAQLESEVPVSVEGDCA
jgi:hypothetical protein